MSQALLVSAAAASGYLAGSIPWGLLLLRLSGGPDPRSVGSGNIGATNVARAGGRLVGVLTLLLDAGKAIVAGLVLSRVSHLAGAVAAACAVVGHCFPPWLAFRGGKGVATLLGATFVLGFPWSAAAFASSWLAAAAAWRLASVASLVASWTAVAAAAAAGSVVPDAALLAPCAALVTVRHAANLRRLAAGREPRLFDRGVPPSRDGRAE